MYVGEDQKVHCFSKKNTLKGLFDFFVLPSESLRWQILWCFCLIRVQNVLPLHRASLPSLVTPALGTKCPQCFQEQISHHIPQSLFLMFLLLRLHSLAFSEESGDWQKRNVVNRLDSLMHKNRFLFSIRKETNCCKINGLPLYPWVCVKYSFGQRCHSPSHLVLC